MKPLTHKQKQHIKDYAIYCTGWWYVENKSFDEGYCWQNAPQGLIPRNEKLVRLSSDGLYKHYLKNNQPPK